MAAAPFVYLRPSEDGTRQGALMSAAFDGNLRCLKGAVKSLLKENGDPGTIFSLNQDGLSVLHVAASQGHLEICKYLVEDLGGDVNAPGVLAGAGGATSLMISSQSGDVSMVKYFLDHGADLMKADVKGRTVLHHAVAAGCCKITEFLLSKGVPVDIDCGCGTPLCDAAINERDKTMKILLDHHANPNIIVNGMGYPLMNALLYHSLKCMKLLIKAGADVNGKGSRMTPLGFATGFEGYTNFIQFLLKAGADPNIPDDLGRLPIERAAVRDCKEEVEMLFPLTYLIPNFETAPVSPPRGGREKPYCAAAATPLSPSPPSLPPGAAARQSLVCAGGGGDASSSRARGADAGLPPRARARPSRRGPRWRRVGLARRRHDGRRGGGEPCRRRRDGWGRAAGGNPRSSSPPLSAAGGGGLAFRLRRCPGVCGVSGLRDLRLVSVAATLAILGWSPAWGPDLNKGGGPRVSLGRR